MIVGPTLALQLDGPFDDQSTAAKAGVSVDVSSFPMVPQLNPEARIHPDNRRRNRADERFQVRMGLARLLGNKAVPRSW